MAFKKKQDGSHQRCVGSPEEMVEIGVGGVEADKASRLGLMPCLMRIKQKVPGDHMSSSLCGEKENGNCSLHMDT